MNQNKIPRRSFLKSVGGGVLLLGCGNAVRPDAKDPSKNTAGAPPPKATPAAPAIPSAAEPAAMNGATGNRLNVLLITTDDLNWDSVGAFGCTVPDITPNIDRLAAEGVRFEHAHVNIAVCQPCRGVIATGRYPHRSGIRRFNHITEPIPTIMQTLQDAGYRTGCIAKPDHSTPHESFVWDMKLGKRDTGTGRDPKLYYAHAKKFIEQSQKEGRPFYLMANSQDPHRPFAKRKNDDKETPGAAPPSQLFQRKNIPIPGFLPDLPDIRKEMSQYFNSVRRADDTVGEVLRALEESGEKENTLVVFLSDHGISAPFGKANVYPASTHTPWIVRWPGAAKAGHVDRDHFISTIDFMPTVLAALGLPLPEGMDGKSFLPLLKGERQRGREQVFAQFHETLREIPFPMRSVQDKQLCYIFNPWSDGKTEFTSESMTGLTFKAMQTAAATDPAVAARVDLYLHRVPEELYDLQQDPDCLVNLADNPARQEDLKRMRKTLRNWMVETGDDALYCFTHRNKKKGCKEFLKSVSPTEAAS